MNRIVSPSIALALGLALNAPASDKPAYAPPKPSAIVEALKLDWHDAKRNRAVPVKIYFPKDSVGALPIVIFSHGLGGSRDGYEYLGRHWAGCGYASVPLGAMGFQLRFVGHRANQRMPEDVFGVRGVPHLVDKLCLQQFVHHRVDPE